MREQDKDPEITGEKPSKKRRSRGRRVLRFVAWVVLVVSLLAGGTIIFGAGRDLRAPDWVRARISQRIEANLPGMNLHFGVVEFVINQGWRPRVRLRDVVLGRDDGQVLVQLSFAEAELAMRPLLRGQVQPREIYLSGALGNLRREATGAVALSLGDGGAPLDQAGNMAQLIEQWDQVLLLPNFSALTRVEMDALTLHYADVGKGRGWTLDGGSARLDRNGDDLELSAGFSLLSGRDYASTIQASYASKIGDPKADFAFAIEEIASEDIALQNVSLAWLDVLRAPISGAIRGGVDSDGTVTPVSATLQIGEGVLRADDQTPPVRFNGARTYFTYDPDRQVLEFDELSIDSGLGRGSADGRAYLNLKDGQLSDLIGQFQFDEIEVNPRGLWADPLMLNGGTADFRLQLSPFRLTLGEALISHADSRLHLTADLSVRDQNWMYALDARIDDIPVEKVKQLWPAQLAPKPRKWVVENLLGGLLSGVRLSLRGLTGTAPVIDAGFAFSDATIRYIKTQPPIKGGEGYATMSDYRFAVMATRGAVTGDAGGSVDISGTSFVIPDVRVKKAAPSHVNLRVTGAVTAALSALNRPPIRVLKETTLPVDMVDGTATLAGVLRIPLKKKLQISEIDYDYQGVIDDVFSNVLVPGHELRADQLQISGDHTKIRIHGSGHISDLPATAGWSRAIGKGASPDSIVQGHVMLSADTIDTFNIGLPPGSVTGQGQAAFSVKLRPKTAPVLSVNSDLTGVGLAIPSLGWRKPEATQGELSLRGALGEQAKIDRLVVKAPGLSVEGSVTNRPGGGLDRAQLTSVQIGQWLNGAVDLVGRPGAAPVIQLQSGRLDMRTAPFGQSSGPSTGGSSSGPIEASLDRLQVTDSIALTGFKGKFNGRGGFNGTFQGRLNGGTPVSGVLVPEKGGSAVQIEAVDAGGVFRDAGIIKSARGGSFKMTLKPTGQPGAFRGNLNVRDTRVQDGRALAALLNAISLVGLIDEMAGKGILFTSVRADFGLSPGKMTIYKSSAEGPSVGLSMDGTYDLRNDALNLRGVLSPLYLLNAIGSVLTRPGEGMFGFSYKLTGPAQDPSVQVNPLSGLAPGLLREVFRRPGPTDPDGPQPATPPPESLAPIQRYPSGDDR